MVNGVYRTPHSPFGKHQSTKGVCSSTFTVNGSDKTIVECDLLSRLSSRAIEMTSRMEAKKLEVKIEEIQESLIVRKI